MTTLFLREHNRIAEILDRQYGWDDERTFQTTRNIITVILLKIVIEEYINHIAPYHFKFFVDPPKFFRPQVWKWQNWMTTEFQLLYRWHPMIPDQLRFGDRNVDSFQTLWNPSLLVEEGLARMFQYASDQPAGEIGPQNTWHWLIDNAEVPSIKMGRHCKLARYNDYREYCHLPRVTAFNQITGNEDVQRALQKHYGSVDNIEYYTGMFCEDVRENSALAPLIGVMVAADAFSQALPNPLLQRRIWNKETFSPRGWEIIHEERHTIDAMVKRNVPELSSAQRDALSITMTRKDWRRT
jgi:prostaglandin-endoperoxide synthase 2